MTAAGIDYKVRSVMVPYGYYIRVMNGLSDLDNSDYTQILGSKFRINGEMNCVNLSDYNFEDRVDSFRIYAVKDGYHAIGDWKKIETEEEIFFEYNTGTYYHR